MSVLYPSHCLHPDCPEGDICRHEVHAVPKPVEVRLEAFRAWVRMQPCLGCGRVPTAITQGQPAHIHTWGSTHNDEANLLPLCVDCHAIQHTIGILTWARSLGLADGWEALELLGVRYWRIFVNGEDFL